MFAIYLIDEYDEAEIFFNGRDNLTFSLTSMEFPYYFYNVAYDYNNDDYSLYGLERLNEYNDNYAIMKVVYEDYSWEWGYYTDHFKYNYLWVDKYGNYRYINNAEMEVEGMDSIRCNGEYYDSNGVGAYSDGVFYYAGKFYDFDMNVVLDIQDKGYIPYSDGKIYSPQFEDGICRMIAYKNDKFWIFDINKSGEIVSEAEEFEILSLSY